MGAALGDIRAYHYADITGADGQLLGRLRYGWRVLKPLQEAVQQYKRAAAAARIAPTESPLLAGAGGSRVLEAAALAADSDPSHSARLRVTLLSCEGLATASPESLVTPGAGAAGWGDDGSSKPYVRFEPPGRPGCVYNSACGQGATPAINERSEWGLARSAEVEVALEGAEMQVTGELGKC